MRRLITKKEVSDPDVEGNMNKRVSLSAISSSKSGFLVFIACLFLMSMVPFSTVGAQNAGPGPQGRSPDQIMAAIKTRLGLTEEQEAKIRPILEDESAKRHAIFEKYQGQGRQSRSSLRDELQQLRATTDQRLGTILTKTQMEEYRKMREEARQHMRRGRNAPAPN